MMYAFIAGQCSDMDVAVACRAMKVSTSGFYEWRQRQHDPAPRTRHDAASTATIIEVHRQSRGTYGSPRVHAELRLGAGVRVGRKRVARLMREAGIEGRLPPPTSRLYTPQPRRGAVRRSREPPLHRGRTRSALGR
jgi:hypothetical protein